MGDNGANGASWPDFLADDRLHPNDRGHRLMADMVVYMLQTTAVDLLMHPMSQSEVAASRAPLPPPMFEGEPPSRWCAPGVPRGGRSPAT
jgi:hypothetical protein